MPNKLGERGTEVAMYDYFNSQKAIYKFKNRFKVFGIIEKNEAYNILK